MLYFHVEVLPSVFLKEDKVILELNVDHIVCITHVIICICIGDCTYLLFML